MLNHILRPIVNYALFQYLKQATITSLILFVFFLFLSKSALASAGCDQVNAGAWNQSLQSFAIGATIGDFDPGDKIHFSVSGVGRLVFLGLNGGAFEAVLFINPPGSQTYTVGPPYTSFRTLNDAVNGPLNITATCTPAPTPTSSSCPSSLYQALTKSFLLSRINGILLNEPNNISLVNRVSHSNITSNWPLNLWFEAGFSPFKNNVDLKGDVDVLYAGVDLAIGPNIIVGGLAQYDHAKDASKIFFSNIEGNGWLIGPYVSARFEDTFFLDVRAGWGRSSNDLLIGSATSHFDTARWLLKGSLSGEWQYHQWRLIPTAELAYMTDHQNAFFTAPENCSVSQQSVSMGRVQFGPEISYQWFDKANQLFEPFMAFRGVWNFINTNALIDDIVIGPSSLWARLQGGLLIRTLKGTLIRGLASWDGIGSSDYNGYTVQCTLSFPMD